MSNIINALIFILTTLFELYIAVVLLRVIFQYLRASFHNPISQFIIKITKPGFVIFRKFIPGFWGIDFAGLVFAYLLALLEISIISYLKFGIFVINIAYLLSAVFLLVSIILNILFWGIILRVIFSFISMGNPAIYQNPIFNLCYLISEPILRPIRNIIPPIAGFDLSPLFAMLLISVLRILFNLY